MSSKRQAKGQVEPPARMAWEEKDCALKLRAEPGLEEAGRKAASEARERVMENTGRSVSACKEATVQCTVHRPG